MASGQDTYKQQNGYRLDKFKYNNSMGLNQVGNFTNLKSKKIGGDEVIIINRIWQMPNSKTFSIKPIEELIHKYAYGQIIDPFANSNQIATITNDLDTQYDTDYHMDALDFLKMFDEESVETVLYDPPFSPRQVSECYKKLGQTVNMQTTQASYWSKQKEQIGRIVKKDGIVITCSWNSGGIGKKYGFEIEEILLVPHGGWHNDTIVVVERKVK